MNLADFHALHVTLGLATGPRHEAASGKHEGCGFRP
jgi:hypothetical protein